MKLTKPKSRNELIDLSNAVRAKHSKSGSLLKDLTDQELFLWIAGKTLDFGRDFESSISNAQYQMEDRTVAEQRFGSHGKLEQIN